MTDIPMEMLRSLITLVECRSYTKAAQQLGLTQPAVSTQIKRLQEILSCALLDKTAPGVRLTERGEKIVDCARRMLSINDECINQIRPIRVAERKDHCL
jgi:DNA-binding transcriptional LysR family regulator